MYSFYLENRPDNGFAYIDHSEEKAVYNLFQNKSFSFISQLWNRYYEDYTFDINEPEAAKKDMMLYLSVEEWNLRRMKRLSEGSRHIYCQIMKVGEVSLSPTYCLKSLVIFFNHL